MIQILPADVQDATSLRTSINIAVTGQIEINANDSIVIHIETLLAQIVLT